MPSASPAPSSELVSALGWSWGHLAIGLAVLVLLLWQAYRWMLVPIPRSQRATLLALRLTWSVPLLWCLWQPVIETVEKRDRIAPPRALVMVDASASMALPDGDGNDRGAETRSLISDLKETLRKTGGEATPWLAFGASVRPWTDDTAATDRQSLVVPQLREVAEQQSAATPTLLFFLTDGEDTAETPASEALPALRAHGVRVFPVLSGRAVRPPPIARLVRVTAPQQVAPNQAFTLAVDARLRTSRPSDFKLLVECDGQPVAEHGLRSGGAGVTHVTFNLRADQSPSPVYTVRLMDSEGKRELSRMSAVVTTKARDALRVLYIQGRANWEYRFVRQAIQSNALISLDGITHLRDQAFLFQPAAGGAMEPREGTLPSILRACADHFDVVVLANIRPDLINAEAQQNLLDFIQKRGGGILFFSGDSAQSAAFRNTLLEQLLPVTIDETAGTEASAKAFGDQFRKTFGSNPRDPRANEPPPANYQALKLTAEGQASEIWRDSGGAAAPQPPSTFEQYVRVRATKPATTILAVHPSEKLGDQPRPLMVAQNIGAGRTIFLGVDVLWRWRMSTAPQVRDYDRFWQQLLFWLGLRVESIAITTDRGQYQPGDTVRLTLRVRKPDSAFQMFVRGPDGTETEIPIQWNAGGTEGKAEHRPTAEGEHLFKVKRKSDLLGQQIAEVRTINLEQEYCGLNETLLQQLATETGGQCLTRDQFDTVPSLFQTRKETDIRRHQKPLWHNPWIYAVMLTAFAAELLLRQKYRLT